MADDPTFKMYEAQAELLETRQELERIRRENEELKNQMAANHLMKTVNNFERKYSNRFEAMEENLRRLTITVSNNDDTFAEIKETLKDLKEAIQVQKEDEKTDDHSKLSGTVGAMQANFNTLSKKVSSSDQILSKINETLRKQDQTLKQHNKALGKQNRDVQVLKKSMKTAEKEAILLLGGWNGSKKINSLLILQNNEENYGNWKQLNVKLPYAVYGHGTQFLNNNLYIFGGQNEKDEVVNSTYKLMRGHKWLNNHLQWEKVADMKERRQWISNSSVVLNDRIWVIGGRSGKGIFRSVEMYDPQTNIWTNKREMNEYRSLAAAAVVYGKIFCCGGWNGHNYLKSAECYDPSSNVWTLISDMPGHNAACGAVEMDGHLTVIGGMANEAHDLNSVWVLDTTDKKAKWIEKEPRLSRPLCKFSIARIDDKIFVCGGTYIDKEDFKSYVTNEVEVFNGQVWRNSRKMRFSLCNSAAVIIPMEFARSLN